jgi:Flp pilus assembly pilin Flp
MYYLMLKQKIKDFINEEDGIGTVEMILILVVLIGLVLIFKEQLNSLVESIFKTINEQAKKV